MNSVTVFSRTFQNNELLWLCLSFLNNAGTVCDYIEGKQNDRQLFWQSIVSILIFTIQSFYLHKYYVQV